MKVKLRQKGASFAIAQKLSSLRIKNESEEEEGTYEMTSGGVVIRRDIDPGDTRTIPSSELNPPIVIENQGRTVLEVIFLEEDLANLELIF